MNTIGLILIFIGGFIFGMIINKCETKHKFAWYLLGFVSLVMMITGEAIRSFTSGEEYGAKKMLRGQYEIEYKYNQSGCPTDTIIKFPGR